MKTIPCDFPITFSYGKGKLGETEAVLTFSFARNKLSFREWKDRRSVRFLVAWLSFRAQNLYLNKQDFQGSKENCSIM